MSGREIHLGAGIAIPRSEVSVETSRSGGPGGQKVNKTETKVTLRFDLVGTESLSESLKARLKKKLAHRLTKNGELLVSCEDHRVQSRNLETAFERLQGMLQEAMKRPKARKKTRPSLGAKRRRLEAKKQQGEKKKARGKVDY